MVTQCYRLYIERRDASRNVARFYAMSIEETLFGRPCLIRRWGRIGSRGRTVQNSFDQELEAVELFLELPFNSFGKQAPCRVSDIVESQLSLFDARRFPQPGVQERMPGRRHRDRVAAAGRAALRRTHRAPHRRTRMGRFHLLPGTTLNNEQELGEYNSKRHAAALTLRELERYIALDIVGSYHQSIHSSPGRPPTAIWREHEGEIPLRLP